MTKKATDLERSKYGASQATGRAAQAFLHYMGMALEDGVRGDAGVELRGVIEDTVEASKHAAAEHVLELLGIKNFADLGPLLVLARGLKVRRPKKKLAASPPLPPHQIARGFVLGAYGPEVLGGLGTFDLAVIEQFLSLGLRATFTKSALCARLSAEPNEVDDSLSLLVDMGMVTEELDPGAEEGNAPTFRLLTPVATAAVRFREVRGWLRGRGGLGLCIGRSEGQIAVLAVLLDAANGKNVLDVSGITAALPADLRPKDEAEVESHLLDLTSLGLVETISDEAPRFWRIRGLA